MSKRNLVRVATVAVALLAVLAALTLPGTVQAQASATVYFGTNVYRIPTTEKICAITLDDAYKPAYLYSVLDTAKAAGVPLTFFTPGWCIDAYPGLARMIVEAGCEIGSHSYSHAWMTKLSTAGMRSQLQTTEDALARAGCEDPAPLFRAPFGEKGPRMLSVLGSEGYTNILWNASVGDTAAGGRTVAGAIWLVQTQLHEGSIILMHASQPSTPAALPGIIREIQARGYRIVRLSEVLFTPEQRMPRYQQNSPFLTYLGSWNKRSLPSALAGSYYWSDTKGAAVKISFTGPRLELLGVKGPTQGKAWLQIDDDPPQEVDLYQSYFRHRVTLFKTTGLEDTAHTATLWRMGEKNPASTGYSINLDAVRVAGALTPAPMPTRHQQDSPEFEFVGPWSTVEGSVASGGSIAFADAPGAAVNVTFDGTYCVWIAKKGLYQGKALVKLDDEAPVTVDLYRSSDASRQKVYNTGLLEDTSHTLTIYFLGAKNPASRGYRVTVDAFDFFGTPSDAPEPTPIVWWYQQSDYRLTYLGAWTTRYLSVALGGSYRRTGQAGAALFAEFKGTSVKLLAATAPGCGIARVTLDPGTPEVQEDTVDLYSASALYRQPVYEKTGLDPDKTHTLEIVCTGDKNALSTGTAINLDAMAICGTMTPTVAPTRYEQDDGALSYLGTWTPLAGGSASGGAWVVTKEAGASVSLAFTGRYLAWISKMSPSYGIAKVTLDAGTPGEVSALVDLYSAATLYKQNLYNTGLLSDGLHTLVIECMATKNPAAGDTNIGVDAFDILGSL